MKNKMSETDRYLRLRPPAPTPDDEICHCASRTALKLMCALGYNPVHCLDCNLEVDFEELDLDARLVDELAGWRNVYAAIDRLWLDSGPYESWAVDQLSDIESPVNVRGRALQHRLEALGRVYYWYFQDESADGYQPISHCPSCAQRLAEYNGGIFRQLLCEDCKIVTAGD